MSVIEIFLFSGVNSVVGGHRRRGAWNVWGVGLSLWWMGIGQKGEWEMGNCHGCDLGNNLDRSILFSLCYLILSICAGYDAESIGPVGNVTSVLCSSLQSTMAFGPFVQKDIWSMLMVWSFPRILCLSKCPNTNQFCPGHDAFYDGILLLSAVVLVPAVWGANSSSGVILSLTLERLHVIRFRVY
jgi:hypothetical protein